MCAIVGSFDKQKFLELVQQNQHRGRVAYSIALCDGYSGVQYIEYGEGEFDETVLSHMKTDGKYIVGHLQSPTSGMERDKARVHPSVLNSSDGRSYLWHNGILMPSTIANLQNLYGSSLFDTYHLHRWLRDRKPLDDIEGSFACVYAEKKDLEIFRSKHAKLYIDTDLTLSSERFPGSKCINADRIYTLDFKDRSMKVKSYFTTKRYNIIIKGELND